MPQTTIDQVSEEKGTVVLSLTQSAPWNERDALVDFQKRLNGYIDAVTHGALYEKYPDLKGRPVRVRLICYHEPPKDIRLKLDRVNQTLAALGISFEIIQINVETEPHDKLKEGIGSFFDRLRGKKR